MYEALTDPITTLRATEFEWDDASVLTLDDRYRQRQLPVLCSDIRPPLSARSIRPGEAWPPVRAVLVPLIEPTLHLIEPIAAFLDDVRRSAFADAVWWPGLDLRAGLTHATLSMTRLPSEAALKALSSIEPLSVVVRGPWIGRYNRGRIYLPVELDDRSAQVLGSLLRSAGIENHPLLSGFLQLTRDIEGTAYPELRDIVRAHQSSVAVPVRCDELWITDTMDDLMLRSALVNRYPFAGS